MGGFIVWSVYSGSLQKKRRKITFLINHISILFAFKSPDLKETSPKISPNWCVCCALFVEVVEVTIFKQNHAHLSSMSKRLETWLIILAAQTKGRNHLLAVVTLSSCLKCSSSSWRWFKLSDTSPISCWDLTDINLAYEDHTTSQKVTLLALLHRILPDQLLKFGPNFVYVLRLKFCQRYSGCELLLMISCKGRHCCMLLLCIYLVQNKTKLEFAKL